MTTPPDLDTLLPAVKEAQEARVSVVSVNARMMSAGSLVTDMHVGLRETTSGVLAGKKLTELGFRYWAGPVEELHVASGTADVEARQATIAERLRREPVAAVVTLNGRIALAAAAAIGETGSGALATYGGNAGVFSAMQRGEHGFPGRDQPTIRGYLAVVALSVILEAAEFVSPEVMFGKVNVVIEPTLLDAERLAILVAEDRRARVADADGTPVFPDDAFVFSDDD